MTEDILLRLRAIQHVALMQEAADKIDELRCERLKLRTALLRISNAYPFALNGQALAFANVFEIAWLALNNLPIDHAMTNEQWSRWQCERKGVTYVSHQADSNGQVWITCDGPHRYQMRMRR